jgi:hypothetical protein
MRHIVTTEQVTHRRSSQKGRRPPPGALGYQVHDVVTKKKAKDRNIVHSPDLGVAHLITGAMNALTAFIFMVKKWIGVWLKFTLGKVLLFV